MSRNIFSYIFDDPGIDGYTYKVEAVEIEPQKYRLSFWWNSNSSNIVIAFKGEQAYLDKGYGVKKDVPKHYAENLHSLLSDPNKIGTRNYNAYSVITRMPPEFGEEMIKTWAREVKKVRKAP